MGKGACFEAASMGFGMIRAAMGCACCLLCCGPICLIIGVTMLVAPNNYKENTDKYNTLVNTFNSGDKTKLLESTGNMNGVSLSVRSSQTPISGQGSLPDGENINPGASSVTLTTASSIAIPASGNITDSNSRVSSITTSSYSATGYTTYSGSVRCPSSSSSSSRSSSSRYCSASEVQQICRDNSGCQSATWSGTSSCEEGTSCSGTCRYYARQTAQCNVLTHSNTSGTFSLSSKYSACLYPFKQTDQPKTCSSSTSSSSSLMTVIFMSDQDPFIQAQEITGSRTMSFGLTEAQQRSVGLALIAVGSTGIGLVVFMIIMIRKAFFKDDESKAKMYGAFGRPYNGQVYTMTQNNMPQQSPYGQQQPPQPYNNFGGQQQPQMNPYGGQQTQFQPPPQQQPYYDSNYQQQPMTNPPGGYAPQANAAYGVPMKQEPQYF